MAATMEKREEIAKVLAGKSVRGEGSLSFSCPKVELSLKKGECGRGSFTIIGREGLPLIGTIVTGDIRMGCQNPVFKTSPAEIFFQFDSTGLDEGEHARGEFKIMSNQGEYELPYIIHIASEVFETSLGQMKNLFHFTNLAKTNWAEAVRLFYRPGFERTLTGNDRQYANIYRALRLPPENEQKVEEFLVGIRKKQKIEYIADKDRLELLAEDGVLREDITLTRNGWGYTRLLVETEGAFLTTEKAVLTDDDFLGNRCQLTVSVDSSRLHAGANYGRLHIYNEYTSMELLVTVSPHDAMLGRHRKNRKRRIFEFYQLYLRYSMGKLTKQAWLKQMEAIVDDMDIQLRVNPVRELFQAHILLTRERYNEAKWVLEKAGDMIRPDQTRRDVWCYYLYLTTLAGENEAYAASVVEQLHQIYREDQTRWEVAWLLLYLDEEYSSPSRKWIFLEQQFEKGCRSPIWYVEAALLARKNPSVLMKLTPFVIQTLNFMAKYDFLTEECISQLHYLAGRLKGYSERMYVILCACYEKKQDLETLRAICSLLIKGGRTGARYVKWYREGIKRELWLTRLYEYYLLSLDLDEQEEIPMAALRYFSYKSELPYEYTAYLYAYVVKKAAEYPDIYRSYLPSMEHFLIGQLEKGHMNRDIGCIYYKLIQEGIVSDELLRRYAGSLFIQEIRLLTEDIRRVIVIHGKLQGEISCPVVGSSAYVPIYDADYSLILENKAGRRFVDRESYQEKTISYPVELLAEILPEDAGMLREEIGVMLYQCEHGRVYTMVNQDNIQYACRLWRSRQISESYKKELESKLLQYYMEHDMNEELDQFLEELQPQVMSGRERAEALRCLILRGMYEKAYEWIAGYGAERLAPRLLYRLCSRLLQDQTWCIRQAQTKLPEKEEQCMTALCYQAFCFDKYDENILCYLSRYYRGTLKELQAIWHASDRFATDRHELSERLLLQMLFTGEYLDEETDIFISYLGESADEALTDGYLEHFAYRYFVCGEKLADRIWRELLRRSRNGEKQSSLCQLAILEYFAAKPYLEDEEELLAKAFLTELIVEKGMMFGFFRRFHKLMPQTAYYDDQTFLEYRTQSEYPMVLHYIIKGGGSGIQYHTEELRSCYPGVYTKHFSLFFGETVEYYIAERRGEGERLVTESSLSRNDAGADEVENRFHRINELVLAVSLQDHEKAQRLLEDYYRTEFSTEKLFTLM